MRNFVLLRQLHAALPRFSYLTPEMRYTKNTMLAWVEPLLHEIAHAVTLGIPVTKKMPDRVSARFADFNDCSPVIGLMHEAHALVVERRVLRRLGWLPHLAFDKLVRDIHEQGMSGPAMPWPTFQSVMRAFGRSDPLEEHAHTCIRALTRISENTTARTSRK